MDSAHPQGPYSLPEAKMSEIVCELEEAKKNAEAEEEKRMMADAKVQYLMKRLHEAQNAIKYHQEEIQQWMVIAEYYQTSCFRCSSSLQEVITLLHGVQAHITFVPWNSVEQSLAS